jgi:Staphylococcus phage HNH endonuclease
MGEHPLYGTWSQMMYRCYNPKSSRFQHYGGRGITVCQQWHDLHAFIEWIESNLGPRPARHSIDRIDNDGNYEPGNVRWATASMQNWNKRPGGPRPGYHWEGYYWPVATGTH